jgi:hypothetical protein
LGVRTKKATTIITMTMITMNITHITTPVLLLSSGPTYVTFLVRTGSTLYDVFLILTSGEIIWETAYFSELSNAFSSDSRILLCWSVSFRSISLSYKI